MSQTARVQKYATHTGRESTSLRAFHARPRPLTYAKYATRPVSRVKPPLYWHFDAPKITESHRLNGTLTRLKSERTARKFFRMRWEKSGVGGMQRNCVFGFPLFLFPRVARLFYICFLQTPSFPKQKEWAKPRRTKKKKGRVYLRRRIKERSEAPTPCRLQPA